MVIMVISATIPLAGCAHTDVRTGPQPVEIIDARATRYQTLMDMAIHKPGERELQMFYNRDRETYPRRPVPVYVPSPTPHHHHAGSPPRSDVPDRKRRYNPDHPATKHRPSRPLPVIRTRDARPGPGSRPDTDGNRRPDNRLRTPVPVVRPAHPASRAKTGQDRISEVARRKRSRAATPVNRPAHRQATPNVIIVKNPALRHTRPVHKRQQETAQHRGEQSSRAIKVNHPARIRPGDHPANLRPVHNNRERESHRARKNQHRQYDSRHRDHIPRSQKDPGNSSSNDTGRNKRANNKDSQATGKKRH